MINITIYGSAEKKDAFTRQAEAEYIKRLSRTARIRFAKAVNAPADAIGLDPSGQVLDSPGLADQFRQRLLTGNELHLILGRPADPSAPCFQLVSLPLSPGMESVLLIEQIYRAFKILAGEPYHK